MELDASFGRWLARRRKALRLARAELASRAGCAAVTLRKIEEDARRPSPELAAKLADHLAIGAGDRERFIKVARGERPVEWLPPAEAPDHAPRLVPDAQLPTLPIPATRLIGRRREVTMIGALLRRDAVRLVILTGPGGVGKTRVAVQAAVEQRAVFADGVVFVALAPLRDPALVIPTIAHALGLREIGSQTLIEILIEHLRPRHMLLVLDNFEHVALAAPAVAELLDVAPQLKLLVTSRSVLHVYGEHDVSVHPLALPDTRQLPPITRLIASDAIQLFSERAQAAQADFAVTSANADVLAQICQRLDRLPLALELVAAWTRILPLPAILARLNGTPAHAPLHLIGDGPHDVPDRQRSLRATIDWSYDLLSETERALFRRLAVFIGGCTLAATEAVASELRIENAELKKAAEPGQFSILNSQFSILEGLASLTDKSMLVSSGTHGEPRFTMLETIREYALERLIECGEAQAIQRQHALYCLHLLDTTPLGSSWLDQVADEYDNMRAALNWALEQREDTLAGTLGQRLEWFWFARGHTSEGRIWLERMLTTIIPTTPTIAMLAVLGRMAGYFAYFQGDYVCAKTLFEASLTRFRDLTDQAGVANLLVNHGMLAEAQGDNAQAHEFFEASLTLRQPLNDRHAIADSLYHLGRLTLFQGDHARANRLLEESLALFREAGSNNGGMVPIVLGFLGYARLAHGADQQVSPCFREALTLLQEQGNTFMVPYNLIGLAGVLATQSQTVRAATLLGAAETLCTTTGLRPSPGERAIWDAIFAIVRGRLNETDYWASWSAGRAMSLAQIIPYSLWEEDDVSAPSAEIASSTSEA